MNSEQLNPGDNNSDAANRREQARRNALVRLGLSPDERQEDVDIFLANRYRQQTAGILGLREEASTEEIDTKINEGQARFDEAINLGRQSRF